MVGTWRAAPAAFQQQHGVTYGPSRQLGWAQSDPALLLGDGVGRAGSGGSPGILTPSKHRNMFCLNEAFRPFLTRIFTLLLGALRGSLMPACGAKPAC